MAIIRLRLPSGFRSNQTANIKNEIRVLPCSLGRHQYRQLDVVDNTIRCRRDQNAICTRGGRICTRRRGSAAGSSTAAGRYKKDSEKQKDDLRSLFAPADRNSQDRAKGESKTACGNEPSNRTVVARREHSCGHAGDAGGDGQSGRARTSHRGRCGVHAAREKAGRRRTRERDRNPDSVWPTEQKRNGAGLT